MSFQNLNTSKGVNKHTRNISMSSCIVAPSSVHVSHQFVTWQVKVCGLVITGWSGESHINEYNVSETTAARLVAHRDISTHHVFPYPSKIIDDVAKNKNTIINTCAK
jgi:hypothetical protein